MAAWLLSSVVLMTLESLSVVAEESVADDGTPQVVFKISAASYELNVCVPKTHLKRLREIPKARWDERGLVQMGTSAHAPVF